MITKTTIATIRQFCKPGIDTGLIPSDQFQELLKLVKNSGADDRPDRPNMLTVKQVAVMLHCSTKSIHRMRQAGRLRGTYLNASKKSLRFPEKAIRDLVEG